MACRLEINYFIFLSYIMLSYLILSDLNLSYLNLIISILSYFDRLYRTFSVAISVSSHVCRSFNFDFYVSKIMHL